MPKRNFTEITNPEAGIMPGSGDDWLSRVNMTIKNFKSLIETAKEFRTFNSGGEGEPDTSPRQSNLAPQLNKAMIVKLLDVLIKSGKGNVTIAEVIEQASPLTIKQVREIISRA